MKKSTSLICIFGAVSLATFASACSGTEDDEVVVNAAGGSATDGSGGSAASTDILIFDGEGNWVAIEENTIGVQGPFFVLEDSMQGGAPVPADMLNHSDLTPDEFTAETPKPCVSGTIAAVTATDGSACGFNAGQATCDFATWGGGIGMSLNAPEGSEPMPWNANAAGPEGVAVQGFSFDVSFGDFAGKDGVRFKATMEGSDQDFCIKIEEGYNKVMLEDLKHQCWGNDNPETLDVTKLLQLQWQMVTEPSNSFEVTNFCVNEVSWF
jgi:hypothetical protein